MIRAYYKYVVTPPPEIIEQLGCKDGMQLKAIREEGPDDPSTWFLRGLKPSSSGADDSVFPVPGGRRKNMPHTPTATKTSPPIAMPVPRGLPVQLQFEAYTPTARRHWVNVPPAHIIPNPPKSEMHNSPTLNCSPGV